MGDPSDADLWALATNGDVEAFGVLLERHAHAIYNFCFRRTADWSAAEDLTSTVFLEAWGRRADVRVSERGASRNGRVRWPRRFS